MKKHRKNPTVKFPADFAQIAPAATRLVANFSLAPLALCIAQLANAQTLPSITIKENAAPETASYVLEVKHTDGVGERGAEKYDRASYVTSLTVMQSEGLAALPAAPAATPNKMN